MSTAEARGGDEGHPIGLPLHEADSVEAVAELHREHHANTTGVQRAIDHATGALGRPFAALLIVAIFVAWIALAARTAGDDVSRPIFFWLELTGTLAALLIAVLILVTQRRADELAERRAQLTLQLAVLADKRSAKIIELLEALRRDDPMLANRHDAESEAMASPSDPRRVAAAIDHRRDP